MRITAALHCRNGQRGARCERRSAHRARWASHALEAMRRCSSRRDSEVITLQSRIDRPQALSKRMRPNSGSGLTRPWRPPSRDPLFFLAQFAGDAAPFNSLHAITKWPRPWLQGGPDSHMGPGCLISGGPPNQKPIVMKLRASRAPTAWQLRNCRPICRAACGGESCL